MSSERLGDSARPDVRLIHEFVTPLRFADGINAG